MTVLAEALVAGARFRVDRELRAYCCTGHIPAGAIVTIRAEQGKRTSPNRIVVEGEPGGIHKVKRSALRMAAEPVSEP